MLLHLLNKTAPSAAFQQCMARQFAEDAIILFEDGVYALLDEGLASAKAKVYVVHEDALARGLPLETLQAREDVDVTVIDYAQWVELSTQYPRSISWY